METLFENDLSDHITIVLKINFLNATNKTEKIKINISKGASKNAFVSLLKTVSIGAESFTASAAFAASKSFSKRTSFSSTPPPPISEFLHDSPNNAICGTASVATYRKAD